MLSPTWAFWTFESRVSLSILSPLDQQYPLSVLSADPSLQDNWSIPYKREESLGRCLVAATKLAAEGLLEQVAQHLSTYQQKN